MAQLVKNLPVIHQRDLGLSGRPGFDDWVGKIL